MDGLSHVYAKQTGTTPVRTALQGVTPPHASTGAHPRELHNSSSVKTTNSTLWWETLRLLNLGERPPDQCTSPRSS
eukprot:6457079-Amphidinium_carterae.1